MDWFRQHGLNFKPAPKLDHINLCMENNLSTAMVVDIQRKCVMDLLFLILPNLCEWSAGVDGGIATAWE